jgi:hypothetical protein
VGEKYPATGGGFSSGHPGLKPVKNHTIFRSGMQEIRFARPDVFPAAEMMLPLYIYEYAR